MNKGHHLWKLNINSRGFTEDHGKMLFLVFILPKVCKGQTDGAPPVADCPQIN